MYFRNLALKSNGGIPTWVWLDSNASMGWRVLSLSIWPPFWTDLCKAACPPPSSQVGWDETITGLQYHIHQRIELMPQELYVTDYIPKYHLHRDLILMIRFWILSECSNGINFWGGPIYLLWERETHCRTKVGCGRQTSIWRSPSLPLGVHNFI